MREDGGEAEEVAHAELQQSRTLSTQPNTSRVVLQAEDRAGLAVGQEADAGDLNHFHSLQK